MESVTKRSIHRSSDSGSEESEQETRYAQSKRPKHGHSVFDLVAASSKHNITGAMDYSSSDNSDTDEEEEAQKVLVVVEEEEKKQTNTTTTKVVAAKRRRKYARSMEARERRWKRKQLKRTLQVK